MSRLLGLALLLPILASSGCAICCAPYDYHYPYVGGRWVRDNPTCGRVGSVFEPAGSRVEIDPAEDAAMQGEPTPAPAPADDGMQSVMPRRGGNRYLPTE
ncbi:MAG: hypothetical protein SFU86_07295 [Pirellulaceae bacterium]|nr:hypothetical protein [Pirellulaceae bacterium]